MKLNTILHKFSVLLHKYNSITKVMIYYIIKTKEKKVKILTS